MNGMILCTLEIDLAGTASVECVYHATGTLDSATLCSGMQKLIGIMRYFYFVIVFLLQCSMVTASNIDTFFICVY